MSLSTSDCWGDLVSSDPNYSASPLILDPPLAADLIPKNSRDTYQGLLLKFCNNGLECLLAFLAATNPRCDDLSALNTLSSFFRSDDAKRLHDLARDEALSTSLLFSTCPTLLWNPFIAPGLLTLLQVSTRGEYKSLSSHLATLSREEQITLLDLLSLRENWHVLRQDLIPWKPNPPSAFPVDSATVVDEPPQLMLKILEFPEVGRPFVLNTLFSKNKRFPTLLVCANKNEIPSSDQKVFFIHCSLVREKTGEVVENVLDGMGPWPVVVGTPVRLDSLKLKATSRLGGGAKCRYRLLFELKRSSVGSKVCSSTKSDCFSVITRRQQLKRKKEPSASTAEEMENRRSRVLRNIRRPQRFAL